MKKFRLRNLLVRYPYLDSLRLSFLAWFCHVGIAFLNRSQPITKILSRETEKYLSSKQPVVFAVYHGQVNGLLEIIDHRKKLTILISQSRDGEIISRALEALGFSLCRGSSSRGAIESAKQLIKAARLGQSLALTVDGPRGPRLEVKPGIIRLAELTKLPIIPFVCCGRSSAYMWGWDRFMACCWGSPIVYIYGDPIFVPQHCSAQLKEELRTKLDSALIKLHQMAVGYWNNNN